MSAEELDPSNDHLDFQLPSSDLRGKVAVVTGASRGIGKGIALALAARGADVALVCHTAGERAQAVCEDIRQLGRKAEYYARDVSDEAEVSMLHDEIIRDFGQVDILVNNAGITRDKSFKKMTREMWDSVIGVDLTGVFLVTKQFVDGMVDHGWGRVINIASVIGEVGNFGQTNYAAAKGGLIAFSKALAREYARKNITVNTVAPGFIKTDMTDVVPEEGINMVVNATPLGRLGLPGEVAAGVAFLASDAGSFITGHVLDINGGYAM